MTTKAAQDLNPGDKVFILSTGGASEVKSVTPHPADEGDDSLPFVAVKVEGLAGAAAFSPDYQVEIEE